MNQRRTIVNTALSNRPAGTAIIIAALVGGLYYLYCLLRVPGAADPYAGVILSGQAFQVLSYVEYAVKIAIKLFLISAILYAFGHTRNAPYTRTPARLWVCSLSLEIVLYIRAIFISVIHYLSAQRVGDAAIPILELTPQILSILTFALLVTVALRSSDVLRATKYFRISVVTTALAVLYLVVHAAQIVSAVRSGAGGVVQEVILFVDGLTVLLPSILLMRAAATEKKVNYTNRGFYMGQKYER